MALSYIDYTGDNATTAFSYSGILLFDDDFVTEASQLKVYVDSVLKTLTTDYSVNASTNTVTFGTAPVTGAKIRIVRDTKSDARFINYTNATNITAEILNTDAQQNFFLAQEAKDIANDAIVVGSDGKWNGRGRVLGSISPGSASTDAVNLGQLAAAVSGVTPATIGNWGYQQYTGDSIATTFVQPTQTRNLSASDIHIFVNGSKKIPITDYTVNGFSIIFATPPLSGHVIQVLWAQGVLGGIIAPNSLTNDMIQDRTITASKINGTGFTVDQVLRTIAGNSVGFGTIPASTISNFDTQVRTSRLDQMAVPTAAVSMGGQKITNLATPVASTDASDKAYVDSRKAVQSTTFTTPSTGALTNTITFNNIKNIVSTSILLGYKVSGTQFYCPITFPTNASITTGNLRFRVINDIATSANGGNITMNFTRQGTDANQMVLTFTLGTFTGTTPTFTNETSVITAIGDII